MAITGSYGVHTNMKLFRHYTGSTYAYPLFEGGDRKECWEGEAENLAKNIDVDSFVESFTVGNDRAMDMYLNGYL